MTFVSSVLLQSADGTSIHSLHVKAVDDCSRLVGNEMIKRLYLRYVQTDLLDMILRQGGYVFTFVGLSVSRITKRFVDDFDEIFERWYYRGLSVLAEVCTLTSVLLVINCAQTKQQECCADFNLACSTCCIVTMLCLCSV